MKLKLVLSAATAICLGVTAAIAAGEPQAVRQDEMKKVGGAMGALGGIAKGEKPYDAEAVKAALTTLRSRQDLPRPFSRGQRNRHGIRSRAGDLAEHGRLQGQVRQARFHRGSPARRTSG